MADGLKNESIAREWTREQLRAMRHVEGDLVVSAAAGSGKTAVLAERCAVLVGRGDCGIENLLVLTFTDAAATEMRARIGKALREASARPENAQQMARLRRQAGLVERAAISTLHAFCARVLRQHFHEAGIDPSFELLDDEEGRLLREEVMEELLARRHQKEDAAFAEFFEAYGQGKDTNCREMIFKLYDMLASSADPAGYVAEAKRRYADERGTLALYLEKVVQAKLRLLGLAARRYVTMVREADAPKLMVETLEEAAGRIEGALGLLANRGLAAVEEARERMAMEWPRLNSPKEFAGDFKALKEATWEDMKKGMAGFVERELALTEAELRSRLPGLAGPLETLLELVAEFTGDYTALKRGQNRLDFSDLERLTLELLQRYGNMAGSILRKRYQHVLVDEFQDINPLQHALLHAVRSAERFDGKGNLFVVGDVKQSIYRFRLAEPGLFQNLEERARATEGRFVALPHNFRSEPRLIAAMNALFEKLLTREVAGVRYREGHALVAGSANKSKIENRKSKIAPPMEVHLVAMDLEEEEEHGEEKSEAENLTATEYEARRVAERIGELIAQGREITGKDGRRRRMEYRDIAILLRAVKNRAIVFARALSRAGIPVHADLSTGFFDAPEVRDTLALLQCLDNPRQDIPLATVLLGPHGRFSQDDLARVRLSFERREVPFAEAVARYAEEHAGEDLGKRLGELLRKLERWRSLLRTSPLHEALARIYAESHIFAYLSGQEAGDQRVANLQALHQRALKFGTFRKQGLHRFLRFIEKLREQDGDAGEAPILSEASNVVRILSVHKSKGLEFPVVIASGLGAKLTLHSRGPVLVDRDLQIGLQGADVERNIYYPSALSAVIGREQERAARAEELRLLYVAFTRARELLILSGVVQQKERLARERNVWGGWSGELPEDELLRAQTSLDWILPALAVAAVGGGVAWDEDDGDALVRVQVHAPEGGAEVEAAQETDAVVKKILAGERMDDGVRDGAVEALVKRVTGVYAHAALTERAALMTVSQLKELAAGEEEIEAAPATQGLTYDRGAMEAAKRRGTATHRILQWMNLAATDAGAEIERLRAEGRLSAEEIAEADVEGVKWFWNESATGKRVREMRGKKGVEILREIPFVWAGAVEGMELGDAADLPTVRGVIDLMIVDGKPGGGAEIVDYKTDSERTWEGNLPAYRKQLEYYCRAAREVLGMEEVVGTIVFLAARREEKVAGSR